MRLFKSSAWFAFQIGLEDIPFVGAAPPVLLACGDAAAALDDLARIELTAEAAADEAADAAREEASGRMVGVGPPLSVFEEA